MSISSIIVYSSGFVIAFYGLVILLTGVVSQKYFEPTRKNNAQIIVGIILIVLSPMGMAYYSDLRTKENGTNYISLSSNTIEFDLFIGETKPKTVTATLYSTSPNPPQRANQWSYSGCEKDLIFVKQNGREFSIEPNQGMQLFEGEKTTSLWICNKASNTDEKLIIRLKGTCPKYNPY